MLLDIERLNLGGDLAQNRADAVDGVIFAKDVNDRYFIANKYYAKLFNLETTEIIALEQLNKNYTRKSFIKNLIRTIDIYIRYKKTLKNAKKKNAKIIIFDRYFYDLILQSKIDFLSKILLKFTPTPDKLFFLYSDPEEIFRRKGERTPVVLKEQMQKFRNEINIFSRVKEIETITEEQALYETVTELNNEKFLGCI